MQSPVPTRHWDVASSLLGLKPQSTWQPAALPNPACGCAVFGRRSTPAARTTLQPISPPRRRHAPQRNGRAGGGSGGGAARRRRRGLYLLSEAPPPPLPPHPTSSHREGHRYSPHHRLRSPSSGSLAHRHLRVLAPLPCAALVPAHLLFLVRGSGSGTQGCAIGRKLGDVCASWISSWIMTVLRVCFHAQFRLNCSGSKLVSSAPPCLLRCAEQPVWVFS